jgi:phospho-N-acetylmuramoyl-pentapeptide-transferase
LTIFLFVYFWVYLINIINFTDGSDGFLTTNSIIFFLTIIIFQLNSQITISFYFASFILPMLLAFFIFNKPPAKIFMGDTGSVLLGFLIGYIALESIINGHINLIVSLLAYTILDCTLTLIIKTMKGNYPWARMFDYYFLIPIKKDKKHFRTFYANLIYNFLNLIIIIIQILYDIELLCIVSIGMSLILIRYYRNTKTI